MRLVALSGLSGSGRSSSLLIAATSHCRTSRTVAHQEIIAMNTNKQRETRRAAVAVEFAVVAPVLLALVMGMVELNRYLNSQNLLESAAREGARFASMDRDGMLGANQSSSQKLAEDVKNYLASNGIPRNNVSVGVKDAANPSLDFDIDDPANDLRLFEVQVSVNYSAISFNPVSAQNDFPVVGKVTFRNGRATISD